jgi:hypothetical protein
MAQLDAVYDALRKAYASGDIENSRKLAAYIEAQTAGMTASQMLGGAAPTRTQRVLASSPGRFVAGGLNLLGGAAQDVAHAASAIGSYAPAWAQTGVTDKAQKYTDDALIALKNKMDEAKAATEFTGPDIAGTAGNIAGVIGGSLFLPESKYLKALTADRKVAGVVSKAPLWKRAAAGTITGAGLGALEPVTDKELPYATQKTEQTALGALGGMAAPVIGAGFGKLLAPTVSPDVAALLARGIRLTPGQIAGGGWKGLEDKLSSIPIAGSFIKGAQARSVDDFNRAVSNDALAHIGLSLPDKVKTGRDTVAYTGKKIGEVYDTVLPNMRGELTAPLMLSLRDAIASAKAQGASDKAIAQLENILEGQFTNRSTTATGHFDGDTLKLIQEDLGKIGKRFSSSDNADDQLVGDAVGDMHNAFNDMLTDVNPQFADTLNGANAAWAKYVRLRTAASRVGAKEGKFTPAQFSGAVRANDASVGKGGYARGTSLMQNLSDPALNVLPQVYPDSGTAGRLGLISGLTALAAAPYATVPAALGAAGLGALYTRPGQALARAAITHAPWDRLGDLAVRTGNMASAPSAAFLTSPSAVPVEAGSN